MATGCGGRFRLSAALRAHGETPPPFTKDSCRFGVRCVRCGPGRAHDPRYRAAIVGSLLHEEPGSSPVSRSENRRAGKMIGWRKLILAAAGIAAQAMPVLVGMVNASAQRVAVQDLTGTWQGVLR